MNTKEAPRRSSLKNSLHQPEFDPEVIRALNSAVKKGGPRTLEVTVVRTKNGKLKVLSGPNRKGFPSSRSFRSENPMKKTSANTRLPTVELDGSPVMAEVKNALSPKEMVQRAGISRTTLSNYRKSMNLLALPKGKKKFVFPEWQLDESGQPLPEMKTILKLLHYIAPGPVDKTVQLLVKSEFYGGKSIKDFIVEGNLKRAVEAAEKRAMV